MLHDTKSALALILVTLLCLCVPATAQEVTPQAQAALQPTAEPALGATPDPTPEPTATPTPVAYLPLKRGDQGEAVSALQQRLSDLGYRPGKVDGIYGGGTYNAVRRLQITLDLSQTGSADADLQARLFAQDAPAFNRYVGVRKGQTSVRVEDMQQRLKDLGYPYVKVSGTYDAGTVKAVHLFQGDNGYEESETVSSAQLQKLYGSAKAYTRYAALEKGDEGFRVELMQRRLKKLGYITGKVSGKYNDKTREAVKEFQQAAGLKANGKASSKTLRKLFGRHAPAKGQVQPSPSPTV